MRHAKKRTKQLQRPMKVHVRTMSRVEADRARTALRSLLAEWVRRERAAGGRSDGDPKLT